MSTEPVSTPPMIEPDPAPPTALAAPQVARAGFRWGPFSTAASVEVTPIGLLAAGGLVSLILLSIVPIIRAARGPRPPAKD
jgi:hypothetical protein